MTGVSQGARALPAPPLRSFLGPYAGYRLSGYPPGVHLGMPAPELTVVVSLDSPLAVTATAHPEQPAGAWGALASGLATSAVTIAHDGTQHGVQLALTPAGSRALLGAPAGALGAWIVDLRDVLGPDARELTERIAAEPGWPGRFAILDEVLLRRAVDDAVDRNLARAWQRLTSPGAPRVADVAREIGWSRRHLVGRFTAEFGVGPKDAMRVARFHRSKGLQQLCPSMTLADVAARCGFYDQAHLAREWRALAGVPPSRWRADEQFPLVQDDARFDGASSGA
ncbi:helix-turn-helix domain-containing protein [Rhodococcus triatomae]|nr:transcriptional regulator [Rhodococcus triatomae BKS 15-14]